MNKWGPGAVIVGGYLLGIFFQNRRIDDLHDSVNECFDVKRVEERLDRLENPTRPPVLNTAPFHANITEESRKFALE